jgi:hypothetical protein
VPEGKVSLEWADADSSGVYPGLFFLYGVTFFVFVRLNLGEEEKRGRIEGMLLKRSPVNQRGLNKQ